MSGPNLFRQHEAAIVHVTASQTSAARNQHIQNVKNTILKSFPPHLLCTFDNKLDDYLDIYL